MNVDLLVTNIGQLITCASPVGPKRGDAMRDVGAIENGAVAIADGKVVAVGKETDVLRAHASANVLDVGTRVVCPGFVDPHTHIVFAGERLNEFELKIKGTGYLDILAAGGGIISTVRSTRAAPVDELVRLGLGRLDKMLVCGTTTCEIKTGYGLDFATEMKMLEAIDLLDRSHPIDIVPTFLAAHAVPPEFQEDVDGYVEVICDEMLPAAWSWYEHSQFNGRTKFYVDAFCEKNAFGLDQTRRVFEAARKIGFTVKVHADEFTNLGASRLAIGMYADSVDHLDAISDEEIALLAKSATVGIVTPTVNFNFGSGDFADARTMVDEGCALALSTDFNPGSAPCPSQPMAMAIACRYQKLLPAEVFNAATINAAHAIGLGESVGSIEVGKHADLVVLATDDYRLATYEFGGNLVESVIKKGKVVYESK